jgi:transcriptional regulatory protein LEU3
VWDRLHICAARQELVVLHLYKSASTLDMQACILIFDCTSKVLDQVFTLDRENNLHQICTRHLQTVVILSLASIARVLKGPFASYLDQTKGSNLIENGTQFLRSCSVQKGDFVDRAASLAEQIWKNQKVFRNPDGSINITLRVRNRLSSGPLLDVIRCWSDEIVDPGAIATDMDIGKLML